MVTIKTKWAMGQFCVQGVLPGTKPMKRKGLESFPGTKQENCSKQISFVDLKEV